MDPNDPNYHYYSQNQSSSQNFQSLLNTDNSQFTQYYQNSQFSPNLNQVPISEPDQISDSLPCNLFGKQKKTVQKTGWSVKEDVALMSSYYFISEDGAVGTNQKTARLLNVGEQRGFPGMIGSIDCMHWQWKNCPTAWAGQYAGRSGKPTIILEAIASYDLWIWHAFFGTPGTCNDINVLQRSPVFTDVLQGRAPKVSYVVNGRENNRAYYLTDGIYPSWAVFVKSITSPVNKKHKLFAQHQEAVRKDVERAFGVLQARFAFLKRPCLVWDKILMGKIMMACIIMHNMIVEDERDTYQNYYDPTEFLVDGPVNDDQSFQYSTERIASLSSYMTSREQLRNREAHVALKNDLVEHIWQKFGAAN